MTQLQNRFVGCIFGTAVGDAVGAPVEGGSGALCQAYIKKCVRPQQFKSLPKRKRSLPFGQYTDDTQLTLLLAQSLSNKADPECFATLLVEAFSSDLIVGSGRATRTAVAALASGVPWDQAGVTAPLAGNGTAMRTSPVGLFYYQDFDKLQQAAKDLSYVTHQAPICTAGAIAISMAVALTVREHNTEEQTWIDLLAERVTPYSIIMAEAARDVWQHRQETPAEMLLRILAVQDPEYPAPLSTHAWEGISPFVLPSVLWSLYAYLHSPQDFWETICTAIYPGGDVDTTAAMAGAISGTHNGIRSMPEVVLQKLQDQGQPAANWLFSVGSILYDARVSLET
jgi:ADP-ribosylglycohydrolase